MGTVSSILDIDVRSESFDRFHDKFTKFSGSTSTLQSVWKNVGKEQAAVTAGIERMNAGLKGQSEGDKQRVAQLALSEKLWRSMSASSTTIFRNVAGISKDIIKWGGLIGGVATGAGLFGIDRLASGVAATRQQAMGFGVSPAAL